MNDDITGITFIYFDCGHIQEIEGGVEIDFQTMFAIHLCEEDTFDLARALQKESMQHLIVFNEKEMKIIKAFMVPERGVNEVNMKSVAMENNMTDEDWKAFLEKLA